MWTRDALEYRHVLCTQSIPCSHRPNTKTDNLLYAIKCPFSSLKHWFRSLSQITKPKPLESTKPKPGCQKLRKPKPPPQKSRLRPMSDHKTYRHSFLLAPFYSCQLLHATFATELYTCFPITITCSLLHSLVLGYAPLVTGGGGWGSIFQTCVKICVL